MLEGMQMPSNPTTVTFLVLAPLILWRLYSRVRRMIGRQKLSKWRARITLIVFPLLIVLLAIPALAHPGLLAMLVAAVACGIGLSVYGIRKTTFEVAPGMLHYTPHAHLGIALSLLFVGRLIYRFFELSTATPGDPTHVDFARSPLTLAIFGLLAGYYVGYAFGLLRWRREVLAAKAEREAAAAAMAVAQPPQQPPQP